MNLNTEGKKELAQLLREAANAIYAPNGVSLADASVLIIRLSAAADRIAPEEDALDCHCMEPGCLICDCGVGELPTEAST